MLHSQFTPCCRPAGTGKAQKDLILASSNFAPISASWRLNKPNIWYTRAVAYPNMLSSAKSRCEKQVVGLGCMH